MFCGKCGTKNPDGAKFCSSCGAPLTKTSDTAAPPQTVPGVQNSGTPVAVRPAVNLKQSNSKKLAVLGVAVLLVIILFVVLLGKCQGGGGPDGFTGMWYKSFNGGTSREVYWFKPNGELAMWTETGAPDPKGFPEAVMGHWKNAGKKDGGYAIEIIPDDGNERLQSIFGTVGTYQIEISADGYTLTIYTSAGADLILDKYPTG